MSTRYTVNILRVRTLPDGVVVTDQMAWFDNAPAWEVAPALKQLAKKIHESPPPAVLEGQESIL